VLYLFASSDIVKSSFRNAMEALGTDWLCRAMLFSYMSSVLPDRFAYCCSATTSAISSRAMHSLASSRLQQLRASQKRKEKTTPFGINLMRSQVLYQVAPRAAHHSVSAVQKIASTCAPREHKIESLMYIGVLHVLA